MAERISKGIDPLRGGSTIDGVGKLGGGFRLDATASPRKDAARVGYSTVKGLFEDHGEQSRP